MEERASGIILRTRPLTETSLIVSWITAEVGRIATVAKGARRSKSPFAGRLDLFYEADFSFQRSRRSELHHLREVKLRETHGQLRKDLTWVHQASYFAVLLERSTETESPVPELHDLFRTALEALPRSAPSARLVHAFELKILGLLGFGPDLNALSAEAQSTAAAWGNNELDVQQLPEPSARARGEIERFLKTCIGMMLERLPPQRERALNALPGTSGS